MARSRVRARWPTLRTRKAGACVHSGLLAKAGVDAIVAAGMGMRPLTGFNQAGITVYFENQTPIVGDAAKLVAAGSVPVMSADNACNHHH